MSKYGLWESLKASSEKSSGREAVKFIENNEWKIITYGVLIKRVEVLRSFLLQQGIKKGDRVALMLNNRPEWPVVFFAIVSLGAVAVPVSTHSTNDEILNILNNSGSKLFFITRDDVPGIESIKGECGQLEAIISVDSVEFKCVIDEEAFSPSGAADINENDTACIIYTSGTTSAPKGVVLSHKNFLSNCEAINKIDVIKASDVVVSILPLHHSYALTVTMLLPLLCGGKILYPGSVQDENLMKNVKESDATIFVGVPQIYLMFYEKIKKGLKSKPLPVFLALTILKNSLTKIRKHTGLNLSKTLFRKVHENFGSNMRLFVSGGASLAPEIYSLFYSLGFNVVEGYGLTETSPVLTFNPLGKQKIGSVGLPLPGIDIKIENIDGDGIGEVVARGPNIMTGYYKRPDLTDEVIKGEWFFTGDLGYIDKEGYLFLTGRSKEVIVLSSGKNIFPSEIEEVYGKNAPVKEMCVFEVSDKKSGADKILLWAIVVPDFKFFDKYGSINFKDIIKEKFNNVSKKLPPHKRLMGFSVTMDPLPRTLLGKIKRFEVKDRYSGKVLQEGGFVETKKVSDEDLKLMQKDLSVQIVDLIRQQTGIKRKINPSDLIEIDLGIDSLGRVELAAGLDAMFNCEIEREVIGKSFTVKELLIGIENYLETNGESAHSLDFREKDQKKGWSEIISPPPENKLRKSLDLHPGIFSRIYNVLMFSFGYMLLKIFWNFKVEGHENIPQTGPCMLYANHSSYFDGPAVYCGIPNRKRLNVFVVGLSAYFDVPGIRHLIRISRIMPLDFAMGLIDALRASFYVLKNRKLLCLFPEGQRSIDGKVGEFRKGFGILTKESKADMVPVYISGAFEAWPRTRKFPKLFKKIKIKIGKPVRYETVEQRISSLPENDQYLALCNIAKEELIKLGENHGK